MSPRAAADAPPQALTKAEAAALLRCSERTVQRRVAAGQLTCIRDSANRALFLPAFIDAYWAEHTKTAARPDGARRSPRHR